jgi:hypothetical protein
LVCRIIGVSEWDAEKIFVLEGIKDDEIGKKLYSAELHLLFFSRNFVSIINSKRWGVSRFSQVWERREFIKCYGRNLNERDHLEGLRRRWYVSDNVVFIETECAVVAWICLGQGSEKWRENMVIIFQIL